MTAKPLVLFGANEIADLAAFYFRHDGGRRVDALAVDGAYLKADHVFGLPVVPFEDVERRFPPADYDLFVATSYAEINRLRARKCAEGMGKGYRLASYVSLFFFNDTATTEIYTLSLHDALPISLARYVCIGADE